MVFPGLFRLVFRSGSECVRRQAHLGALGGVWGLWRGTHQRRAALRGRGFAGVRLLAGQRGNKGKKGGMGTCFTSAQRAGDVQRGKAAVQRSCGGGAAAPSSMRRQSVGNGLLGVLLVVWCGGGNTRSSCKAVEWVRIVGTAQTARNADGKLIVAVRAELQRRGGAAVGFRGN